MHPLPPPPATPHCHTGGRGRGQSKNGSTLITRVISIICGSGGMSDDVKCRKGGILGWECICECVTEDPVSSSTQIAKKNCSQKPDHRRNKNKKNFCTLSSILFRVLGISSRLTSCTRTTRGIRRRFASAISDSRNSCEPTTGC
jgi:hypothetical protein